MKFQKYFVLILLISPLLLFAVYSSADIIKGPYLLDPRIDGATVKWEESVNGADGLVRYGLTDALGQEVAAQKINTMRMAVIRDSNLTSSTRVYYQVVSGTVTTPIMQFFTGPDSDEPFTIVVYGDVRTNPSDHQLVVQAIQLENPSMVISTGDYVTTGFSASDWNDFFNVADPLMQEVPYVPLIGNHEQIGGITLFKQYFNSPLGSDNQVSNFALQYGNSLFLTLDISLPYSTESDQKHWLDGQLTDAKTNPAIKHVFVLQHFGIYSSAKHGNNNDVLNFRNSIDPSLVQNGIDADIGGHDHDYEHSFLNNINYFVSGGGGAPLYDNGTSSWTIYSEKTLNYLLINIDGEHVKIEAKRPDGTLIEKVEFDHNYGPTTDDDTSGDDDTLPDDDTSSSDDDLNDDSNNVDDDSTGDDDSGTPPVSDEESNNNGGCGC